MKAATLKDEEFIRPSFSIPSQSQRSLSLSSSQANQIGSTKHTPSPTLTTTMTLLTCTANMLFSRELGHANLATLAALIGTLYLGTLSFSFLSLLYTLTLRPATRLSTYGAKKGAWAVITGASDGIGKEFAIQLAKAGFNIVVLARTLSKLEAVAAEARKLGVEAKVLPFDFAAAGDADYETLGQDLSPLNISVLINNVGVNHDIPTSFTQESSTLLNNIIKVDVGAQVSLTRLLLPTMISRKNGLVLNIGSAAGLFPTAYLATYSGAKAFLRTWSRALAVECRPHGVHVQHVKTYFVSTAMSKIRRASLLVPTPKDYVKSVLASAGQATDSAPYPTHALATWVTERLPDWLTIWKNAEMHLDIRKRALRKREREAAKKQ
ncbi:hypothetical protein DFS34DRAFT_628755 [Phlyctochytrium arcticum]|nr:hypothetical protein DFS34DRAFT_628755 [Phlyctochytrium arcticum]